MDVGAWAQAGFASAAFLFGARALYNYANNTPEPEGCSYLPWPGNSITSSTVIPVPQITSLTAGGHAEGRSSSASGSSRGVGGASAQGGGAAAAAAASGGGGGGGISSGGSGGGGFGSGELITAADIVVVDCTHPLLPTLSHHKGARNPAVVKADDTSTGIVLNALLNRSWNRELASLLQRRFVTTNHFDVDSFLSVWAYVNRAAAVEHEAVLRHMARIGDFREAYLSPDLISAHGAHDNVTFIREAYTALKLVCWINTLEQRLFSAPYESQGDCDAKMAWFLPRFESVLRDPESAWGDWQAEYTKVVSGFDILAGADCMVETPPGLGLAVLSAPEPLHYISMFSHTIGYDTVLMMYDDNRYEVESKYTQFIDLVSRPVWPRLDLTPLAAVLNQLEARYSQQQQQQQHQPLLHVQQQQHHLHLQQQQQQHLQQQQGPLRTGSGNVTPGYAIAAAGGGGGGGGGGAVAAGGSGGGGKGSSRLGILQQQQQQQQQGGAGDGGGDITSGGSSAGGGSPIKGSPSYHHHHHHHPYHVPPHAASAAAAVPPAAPGSLRWVANSLTDTGPLLRLQGVDEVLSKAQRYGQPYERYIHSSAIPPHKFQAIVQSYLGFGLQGLKPRLGGGWEWSELQELNAAIHWQDWASCIIQQASRGELDVPATATMSSASAAAAAGGSSSGSALLPHTPRQHRLRVTADNRQQHDQQQQLLEMQPLGRVSPTAGLLLASPGPTSPANLAVSGVPLPAAQTPPVLSQPSVVASPAALAALAAALPPLHQGNPWLLLYSTARDGISLATLMRKAEKVAPSLLLVKDAGGAVFGAYVSDAWRYNPRFYGTGETFVFQLEPARAMWPWLNVPGHRNDFFQYATHEDLGVGGAGHWALHIEEDLIRGSSGPCDTFGSPCLASKEEFEILAVELWHVH